MEPAVKLALNQDDTHRVLVAATPITIRGNKLKCLVEHYDGHHLVDLLPLPGLVRFAEKGIYSGAQVHAYLSEQLAEFNLEDYAAFVLGCTHFNLFKQELRTLLPPQMHFVDGNAGTVRQLIRKTVDLPATHGSTPGVTYFASGRPITRTPAPTAIYSKCAGAFREDVSHRIKGAVMEITLAHGSGGRGHRRTDPHRVCQGF